jgi:pimeloyl-ACP methyl ester carboxylesterase
MVTGETRLSDATLFYRESGTGRPALFVHALLIDSRLWLDQLRGLGDLRRCLAPDLSGFGFSSPIAGDKIDMARHADELLAYLDAMQVREPVDAVGLSAGGNILLLAYLKQPQRFRSAVLISTGVGGGALDPAGVRYRAENARTVVIDGKDTLYRRFNEYIVSPNAPLFARALQDDARADAVRVAGRVPDDDDDDLARGPAVEGPDSGHDPGRPRRYGFPCGDRREGGATIPQRARRDAGVCGPTAAARGARGA